MEIVARAAQLIELRRRDHICGVYQGLPEEDSHLYMGTGRTRGLLMVALDLEAFVAQELSKETATMKERRKAREEKVGEKPNTDPKDTKWGSEGVISCVLPPGSHAEESPRLLRRAAHFRAGGDV